MISISYFVYSIVTFISFLNASDEVTTTPPPPKDERKPSQFKIGDEWLALPEVFSNLNFQADNTPASDNDIEGQMTLRSTRFWGRIYIDGWPQTIQFFRAHFGIEPPFGRKRFVFAEPRDACTDLENAHLLTSEHVVFVNRGKCTFGQKALNIKKTLASAVIIINNEPGIDHLPGPDAHDVQLSVSSISQQEGSLIESFYDEGPQEDGFGRLMNGYMVPINCESSGSKCTPATVQEKLWIKDVIEGGIIQLYSSKQNNNNNNNNQPISSFEYLLAHFGSKVLHSNFTREIVMSKPAEACDPLEKDVKGKVVLVRRGTCPFVQKAENIQNAGGVAIIISSLNTHIFRMGVEPRWKGLNTAIPVISVTKNAYNALVAESYTGGTISFKENLHVNSSTWENIEKLKNGESWPRSSAYITKKFEELQVEYNGWPERLEAIQDAYNFILSKEKKDGTKSEL